MGVNAAAVATTSSGTTSITGTGGVTITAGSNTVAVSSEVVVSSSKVTNYEGGLAVGRSNSDSAIDSGGHTPLERATISRIFKLDIAVAFNTDNLHPGSEVEVKQGLSTSSDGDYVE